MVSLKLIVFNLHGNRVHLPDILGILTDGAIAGEFAHAGYIEDRHPRPSFNIFVGSTYRILGLNIGSVVSE